MRELVFLPDRDGYDEFSGQAGFVRLGADAAALGQLAERLRAPETSAQTGSDLLWSGYVALALLADVWVDGDAVLKLITVDASTSLFASWVLAARPAAERDKPVQLLVCCRKGKQALLGIADAACGFRLPAALPSLAGIAPERAAWIDQETGMVSDPVPYLTERDRRILADRITLLKLDTPAAATLLNALQHADAAEENAVCSGDEAAVQRLELRLQAVHGLADFSQFAVKTSPYALRGNNPLMQCLAGGDVQLHPELGQSAVYLWDGVPFARTSSRLGLTGVGHPEEASALAALSAELGVMAAGSVKWNHQAGTAIRSWADDRAKAAHLLPEAKERILALATELRRRGQQVQSAVTLMWPWDAGSGAVRMLLQEALGDNWMKAAAQPFSDRLTKLTGHVLGDTALNTCCACSDGVLLPPLSREMAACVAAVPIGSGLALDAMRFEPQTDGGITASFLLRGSGEVRMMRHYTADEILVLNETDSASAAVWPCLPMASWRAYHVFSRGNTEVAALCGGEWTAAPVQPSPADAWRCLKVPEYPACLSLSMDGLCLGALPNMLPAFTTEAVKPVTVAIDMGSCETAVAFASGEKPSLIEGQELTRRLVMPQNAQEDVFLSGLRPRSIVPTAAMLSGTDDGLFTGGCICVPETLEALAAMDAARLRTGLKWRADAESVRARRLFLHQVMLGAALTAVMDGAKSIAWRATVADEMGDEGREALLTMLKDLSLQVAEESGLPLAAGTPAITWAEESAALCTSLRLDGVGRGSYISVDLGGGSTKMHLWMQGQQRPLAGAVVLEGMQSMLVRALQDNPNRLLEDFADCGDEQLLQAVVTLTAQLNQPRTPRQTDKTGLMLDRWLDMHRERIIRHIGARMMQQPTWMQSVLLESCAAVMYTVGLMLRQVCDNTMINHRLPEDITVCLTGRGAWLLETLTPQMRGSLQNLARISLRVDHPVRFVTLKQAALPAQCVATGLAVAKDVQRLSDAPPIRTRESFSGLMRTMVQKMCAAFPAHMWQLHEGLMDWQGSLTMAGDETIRRVAAQCYGDGEDIPASVLAFIRTLRSEMILPDHRANGSAY